MWTSSLLCRSRGDRVYRNLSYGLSTPRSYHPHRHNLSYPQPLRSHKQCTQLLLYCLQILYCIARSSRHSRRSLPHRNKNLIRLQMWTLWDRAHNSNPRRLCTSPQGTEHKFLPTHGPKSRTSLLGRYRPCRCSQVVNPPGTGNKHLLLPHSRQDISCSDRCSTLFQDDTST
jgi:hypothetical protein